MVIDDELAPKKKILFNINEKILEKKKYEKNINLEEFHKENGSKIEENGDSVFNIINKNKKSINNNNKNNNFETVKPSSSPKRN